jgi:hypothetical protein
MLERNIVTWELDLLKIVSMCLSIGPPVLNWFCSLVQWHDFMAVSPTSCKVVSIYLIDSKSEISSLICVPFISNMWLVTVQVWRTELMKLEPLLYQVEIHYRGLVSWEPNTEVALPANTKQYVLNAQSSKCCCGHETSLCSIPASHHHEASNPHEA